MSNKIRGPERNFCQIRLVSGSLDCPCHDLYYTQLKCYRTVRSSRDISHFVHFLRKKQLKKKQCQGAVFEPLIATSVGIELYRSRYLRNLEETSLAAMIATKKSVDREKSPIQKSRPFFFRTAKISTLRDPERNSCRTYLKPGSFDPHYQQYFYTHLKRYLKVRGSRVIFDFLNSPLI